MPVMASSTCWKCLSRPSLAIQPYVASNVSSKLPPLAMAFSTSTPLEALAKAAQLAKNRAKKGPNAPRQNERAAKTLRVKKKAFVKTGRPPAPGERKALRKRIVLSNVNALEVQGLVDMAAELDSTQIGKVLGLPGPLVDQLRAVEAFKATQGWGMFRRPAMLIRKESLELAQMMEAAQRTKKTSMTVFYGEKGAGKSLMLLQALATAFLKGWIVLNIPEAQEITMAMTEYTPIPETKPTLYSQNAYTANWLSHIAKANNDVLSKLKLNHEHDLPVPTPPGTTLARLAELGGRDPEAAWPIFIAFWREITSKGRPPVLLALDGLHHIMRDTLYRSPDYKLIHAHDLALVRHFVDHLSGAKQLPNGGAVLAATTTGNSPQSVATDTAIKQHEERQAGREVVPLDPFTKYDMRAYASLQAARVMRLKGLSKEEARGLMEYWAASGILRQRVDEKAVAEKWALAGCGIVGEIERSALRMRI